MLQKLFDISIAFRKIYNERGVSSKAIQDVGHQKKCLHSWQPFQSFDCEPIPRSPGTSLRKSSASRFASLSMTEILPLRMSG